MNFKRELLDKIKLREKTQTRRPYHPEDCAIDIHGNPGSPDSPYFNLLGEIQIVTDAKGRTRYEVGKVYAVCPGRGKTQECKMRLTKIRYEDVREIHMDDVRAEGFTVRKDFLKVWSGFYDKHHGKHYSEDGWEDAMLFLELMNRPSELYQAWALTFELV